MIKGKILWIDDEIELLKPHILYLEKKDYLVTSVSSGEDGIKIFNDKEVDELLFLDIDASKEKRGRDYKLLENIATECFMPLGYGGGISNVEQVNRIFNIGIEKLAEKSLLNTWYGKTSMTMKVMPRL